MAVPSHPSSATPGFSSSRELRSILTALLVLVALPILAAGDVAAQEQEEDEKTAQEASHTLPLEPERTFTRTFTEGSWISLDVSPDGETLVFDLLGDLYLLPIEGGEAERLTHGIGFDSQPRFSPDGSRILFVSDRDGGENLWTITADGEEVEQITEGKSHLYHSPEWTPDGEYVIASRSDLLAPAKPWIFHVEGGTGIQMVEEPENLRLSGAAFGADERYVWFARRTGTWQYNAIFPQYQLVEYDRDTGQLYTRSSRHGSAFRPALSPDGRWLVYGTRHEGHTGLRLRDLESGEERWLAYPVQRDDKESIATRDVYPGMAFTPGSEALIASYDGGIWRIPLEGEPEEIPFTAEVEVAMGPELDFDYPVDDAPTFTAREIRDAVPSPDGSRIAFTALDRLYVAGADGTDPRSLTDGEATDAHPTWSPDGRWIAFATWSEEEGGHVRRVRADGRRGPERLTPVPAIYQRPAWSPDGRRIVAIRGPARAYREATGPFAPGAADDIVWLPAEGGEVTRVAPTEGRGTPHFRRAEPDRIYLHHGQRGLLSVRFDGTDEKVHVRVKGPTPPGADEPVDASLVRMAPEGDQAVAQVLNHLYTVTVPYVGDPPTISVANPERAPVPVRKLTRIGGQFPAWSGDGRRVHWSIGNAHFIYDLDEARAAEEEARKREREREEEEEPEDPDVEETDENDEDENDEPVYEPEEFRVAVEARRDLPEGVLVLRGVRAVTMRGDEVLEDADVVIRDHRIEAVGPRGEVDVPEGAEVRDLSGHTVVPGFVDIHAHMWPAWGIHKTQIWQYLANLAYGVTTTRDPQTATTDVLTYTDRVESGDLLGPRIYSTGPGVFWAEEIGDLDDARDVLKRYSDYYDTKTIKMYLAGNREQRQWIIQAAREQELMPTTEGALDLKLNLTQIIDGYPGHEHSFPISPLYRDVVDLVAESRTAYTPTLLVAYGGPWAENWFFTRENPHEDPRLRHFTPHEELASKTRRRGSGTGPGPGGWFMDEEHIFPQHAEVVRDIVEAGGRAGVGSHGQLQGLGFHWELWAMAAGGMSEHDALRVATLQGADAIGLDGDLGSLEAGKLADLVVLEENPLDDLRNTNTVRYVMKNGRLYEADTLDEVWPRQVELEEQYWQGTGPEPRTR